MANVSPLSVKRAVDDAVDGTKTTNDEEARRRRVLALRTGGFVVELSGGQSATLADPATVTNRQMRAMKKLATRMALAQEQGQPVAADDALAVDDLTIATFLREWSLPIPLPTPAAPDPVQDLTERDYQALAQAARDLLPETQLDLTVTPEEASPFGP